MEVNFGTSVDVGRIHFSFGTLQTLGSHQKPQFWKKTKNVFLQCEAKIVRRLPSRQRSGVVSQQRLRPRLFDSAVKYSPKLRFEHVSFVFLVCFSIEVYLRSICFQFHSDNPQMSTKIAIPLRFLYSLIFDFYILLNFQIVSLVTDVHFAQIFIDRWMDLLAALW